MSEQPMTAMERIRERELDVSPNTLDMHDYRDLMEIHAAAAVARVERERDAALAVVRGFLDIVSESRGVDGWHRNGDVAEWDEFDVLNQAAALKETP